MTLTLLGMVQRAARRLPLSSVPTEVVGSSSPMSLQFLEMAQETGDDLRARHEWQRLDALWTITIGATSPHTENYPDALDRFQDKSLFWRSDSTYSPLIGPLSPAQWQLEVNRSASPWPGYWRRYARGVQILGVPATKTVTRMYVSKNWIATNLAALGTPTLEEFANDANVCIFPDRVMVLGIRWRWKQSKGLEYAQDFEDYEELVFKLINQETSRETIHSSPPEPPDGKLAWGGTVTPVS